MFQLVLPLPLTLCIEQKVESNIDGPPTASSSVASSADVSEKSQELTKASTPPTGSVKKLETTTDVLGLYEPNVPVGKSSFVNQKKYLNEGLIMDYYSALHKYSPT